MVCDLSILIILMPCLVKMMLVSKRISLRAAIRVRKGAICRVCIVSIFLGKEKLGIEGNINV